MIEDSLPQEFNTPAVPGVEDPEVVMHGPETVEQLTRFQRLAEATRHIGSAGLTAAQAALVLLQVSPANEVVRLGAFGAGEAISQSPVTGAISYGAATLGVEVAGALAGAPLLDSGLSEKILGYVNKKTSKAKTEGENHQYSATTKMATAFIGGTVPAMALEKLEDPSRTAEHTRRYGLWTSVWLAGACAVQGAAMAEGIDIASSDTKVVAGAAGVAVAGGFVGWLKRRLARNRSQEAKDVYLHELDTVTTPQRAGLGDEEFIEASNNSDTISAEISKDGKEYTVPVLTPTTSLYWYNQDLLGSLFPNTKTYFYTQAEPQETVVEAVNNALQNQDAVLTADTDISRQLAQKLKPLADSADHDVSYESLQGAYLNQYVGLGSFEPDQEFRDAPDFITQYRQAVAEGIIHEDPENGAAIIDKINGEDADRLWKIYEKPFEGISMTSPINAGFDKEGFYKALEDPSVVKVINRVNGTISTVALFGMGVESASWLNDEYFAHHYPDAHDTGNILLFLGIVSDENMRGSGYSLNLLNLLMQVGKLRNSKTLITFECNEVSSNYLPKIVEQAINSSDIATITGLDGPVAQTRFSTLRLKSRTGVTA